MKATIKKTGESINVRQIELSDNNAPSYETRHLKYPIRLIGVNKDNIKKLGSIVIEVNSLSFLHKSELDII